MKNKEKKKLLLNIMTMMRDTEDENKRFYLWIWGSLLVTEDLSKVSHKLLYKKISQIMKDSNYSSN